MVLQVLNRNTNILQEKKIPIAQSNSEACVCILLNLYISAEKLTVTTQRK